MGDGRLRGAAEPRKETAKETVKARDARPQTASAISEQPDEFSMLAATGETG